MRTPFPAVFSYQGEIKGLERFWDLGSVARMGLRRSPSQNALWVNDTDPEPSRPMISEYVPNVNRHRLVILFD